MRTLYFLALFAIASTTAFSQILEIVDQEGGFLAGVDMLGNDVYVSQGEFVRRYKITNGRLERVAQIRPEEGVEVGEMVVEGAFGYVRSSFGDDHKLYVLDLSISDEITLRGSLDLGGRSSLNSIAVSGNIVLLSQGTDGVHIVDVTDPDGPVRRTTFDVDALGVFVAADRAYITSGTFADLFGGVTTLHVLDLADPSNPIELGTVSVPVGGEIVVNGTTAYTTGANFGTGIRVIDVSTPGAMAVVDSIALSDLTGDDLAQGIRVKGSELYAIVDNSLRIYDITTPGSITEKGSLRLNEESNGVGVGTTHAVVAGEELLLIDIGKSVAPSLAQSVPGLQLVHDIAISGTNQYVADANGIYLYDVSDSSASPIFQGIYKSPGTFSGYGRVVGKDKLAVALKDRGDSLVIVDFSNPANPVQRGGLKIGSSDIDGGDLGLRGDIVYVTHQGDERMTIVNIADPALPTVAGTHEFTGFGSGNPVEIHVPETGNRVFVARNDGGSRVTNLEILNVSNPAAVTKQGEITERDIYGFTTQDNLLYYGHNTGGTKLKVVDVSNPASPAVVEETPVVGPIWDITVVDTTVITSIPGGSIHTFFFNPLFPAFVTGPVADVPKSATTTVIEYLDGKMLISTASGFTGDVIDSTLVELETRTLNADEGIFFILFCPGQEAILTLGLNSVNKLVCPPESKEEEIEITAFSLEANIVSDWQVNSIGFDGRGSGDEAVHVDKVRLYEGQNLLAERIYGADNGTVILPINRLITRGQIRRFRLVYTFDTAFTSCPIKDKDGEIDDVTPQFLVFTSVAQLSAQPTQVVEGTKLPPGPLFSRTVTLACVQNTKTGIGFNMIQEAVDDINTKDGDFIRLCPGFYEERVEVRKGIDISSMKGRDVTTVKSATGFSVFEISSTQGAKLRDLTIIGGPHTRGVRVSSSRNVEVTGNLIQDSDIGLNISSARGTLAQDNAFENNGTGIQTTGSSISRIIKNTIAADVSVSGRLVHGISLTSSSNDTIRGNKITIKTGRFSVGIGQLITEGEFIDGNSIEAAEGISSNSGKKNFIVFNTVQNCERAMSLGNGSSNNVVHGNRIVQNRNGISLGSSNGTKITKNEITLTVKEEDGSVSAVGRAIELRKSDNTEIRQNRITRNFVGVHLKDSKNTKVVGNTFQRNRRAAVEGENSTAHFAANDIDLDGRFIKFKRTEKDGDPIVLSANQEPVGMYLENSSGTIRGNRFREDSTDAVFLTNGSDFLVRNNLLLNSHRFGVNNNDPSITIDARNNWWGHPSGPGGEGSGAGDGVSPNVDFDDWLEEPVTLIVATGADTIFVPRGTEDSLFIVSQNWANREDIADVTITDDLSWIQNGGTVQSESVDSVGGEVRVDYSVPETISDGTVNVIRYTGVSTSDGTQTDRDSIVLIVYTPELTDFAVAPDTFQLEPNDQVQFAGTGVDQHGRLIAIGSINWIAAGGTIDGEGIYTAGTNDGLFEVTGTEALSGMSATGYVQIGEPLSSVQEQAVAGELLEPNLLDIYPNPSDGNSRIRFALKRSGRVSLALYDALGKEVAFILAANFEPGEHEVSFTDSGLENGVYYVRMSSGGHVIVRRLIVVR